MPKKRDEYQSAFQSNFMSARFTFRKFDVLKMGIFSDLKFRPLFFNYRKIYGVIPIVAICVIDVCWMTYASIASLYRTEVILTRKTKPLGQLYDLIIHPKSRKFYGGTQTYEPNKELYDVYMEMEKAIAERKGRGDPV